MNARHNRWSARCNASREFIGWDCQRIALIDIIHRHSDIDLFAEAPNPSTASPANRRDIIASAMAASRPNAAGQFDVLTLAILAAPAAAHPNPRLAGRRTGISDLLLCTKVDQGGNEGRRVIALLDEGAKRISGHQNGNCRGWHNCLCWSAPDLTLTFQTAS